jgi:thioredoxin-dependent peroxiredoxin
MVTIGQSAPDFTLLDQDGKEHILSAYRGQYVLIYFYPKDDTPGCTKEACAIRDAEPDFKGLDAIVLGISPDTVKSHKKFAEKYGLPFTLLADPEHVAIDAYGVWGRKKFMGREYDGVFRTSFLIAPDGTVAKVYETVKPEVHAAEVLADLAALR